MCCFLCFFFLVHIFIIIFFFIVLELSPNHDMTLLEFYTFFHLLFTLRFLVCYSFLFFSFSNFPYKNISFSLEFPTWLRFDLTTSDWNEISFEHTHTRTHTKNMNLWIFLSLCVLQIHTNNVITSLNDKQKKTVNLNFSSVYIQCVVLWHGITELHNG